MTTALDIKRERDLLSGMGLQPVKHWPPRCVWYKPDGTPVGKLGCDSYSRLLYLGKGLRPEVAVGGVRMTLEEAVVGFMKGKDVWEGTGTELLEELRAITEELPPDATRLSKSLGKLASQKEDWDIAVERTKTAKKRGIRLSHLGE